MTQHEAEELPNLLGDASTPVCASFFQVHGELPGFLLLVMPVHEVTALLEPLVGQGEGEMADSAIGEIGNIVGRRVSQSHRGPLPHLCRPDAAPGVSGYDRGADGLPGGRVGFGGKA